MSDFSASPRLRRGLKLVGGRYALSPWLIAGSAPLLIFGFVATEVTAATRSLWWAYAIVGLVGQLVLGLVLAVASLFPVFARNRQTPWQLVVGVYLLGGEMRMVALVLGLDAFDLPDTVPLWARVMTSALLIPLAYGLSSYALEALAEYREQRAGLISRLVAATGDLERQQSATETFRRALVSQVGAEIQHVNQEVRRGLTELSWSVDRGDDVRPELRELLEQSDRRWRRISHDTWSRANVNVPQPSGWEIAKVLARSKPLSLVTLGGSSIFLFALALRRSLDLVPALFWTALWIVLSVSLAWALNEVSSRVSRASLAASLSGLVALVASGAWLAAIPGLGPTEAAGAFAIHITNVFAALIIGFAPSLVRNRQLVLDALQSRLDASTIERLRTESELVVVAQQVAQRLHTNARGEWLARVVELQHALDRDDRESAQRSIAGIIEALDDVGIERGQPTDDDLMAFLSNWAGFVDIEHNLGDNAAPEHLHPAVNRIVMEAVANAVRHGEARRIEISLKPSADGWTLEIRNDGRAVSAVRGRGVGTRVLDQEALGAWTLMSDSDGTTLLRVHFSSP